MSGYEGGDVPCFSLLFDQKGEKISQEMKAGGPPRLCERDRQTSAPVTVFFLLTSGRNFKGKHVAGYDFGFHFFLKRIKSKNA